MPQHPLNPFDVAKNTDNCQLIFIQPLLNEAMVFLEGNTQQQIECTDFNEFEILKFDRVEQADYQLYTIFGSDNHFCEWRVQSKGLVLNWNELVEYACFVNSNGNY